MFGVVNAVFLEALPFGESEKLVQVLTGEPATGRQLSVSYPDFLDWRTDADAFVEVAALGDQTFTLTGSGAASQVEGELVSANYFRTLGVEPARGRGFTAAKDVAGAGTSVVASDRFWRDRFGADEGLLGSTMILNDSPYEVIGIAPRGFHGYGGSADVWVPMGMFDAVSPSLRAYDILGTRSTRWHTVVARLADGRSIDEGRASLDVVAARLADTYPGSNEGKGVLVTSVRQAMVGDLRTPLFIVLGAAGFLLLVACANIATLLMARSSTRAREFAIRASLGAGRVQIIRQLLAESAVLGLLGAGLGLVFTAWVIDGLMSLAPPGVPSFVSPEIDGRVVGFTLIVSLATTLLFGLGPALGLANHAPVDALKGVPPRAGRRFSGQAVFVVVQLALALALEAGAGLMIRSVLEMQAFEPGFDWQRVATTRMSIPPQTYPDERADQLMAEVRARLEALPCGSCSDRASV